jgi:hypothetical protein
MLACLPGGRDRMAAQWMADADGDGYSNEEEKRAGTDPLDPLSFPEEK